MARTRQFDILNQPIVTLLLTFGVLLGCGTVRAHIAPFATEQTEGVLSPVGLWLDSMLGPYFGFAVVLGAILLASVILTRIINRYSLSLVHSFMPMVLFMICILGVVFPAKSPALMLALLMLTQATDLMFISFKRHTTFGQLMSASFWTALAALLVPEMVYLLLLLPVQWFIWQRSPREMIAAAIMTPLPMLLGSCIYWFAGKPFGWLMEEWSKVLPSVEVVNFAEMYTLSGGVINCVLWGAVVLLTLVSILVFMGGYGAMRTRARKGHIFFSLLYLMCCVMFLLGGTPTVVVPLVGFAAVPLIHTFFVRRKGVVSAIIYIILVSLTLATSLF
jgi:hypothetical protein